MFIFYFSKINVCIISHLTVLLEISFLSKRMLETAKVKFTTEKKYMAHLFEV